LKVSANVKIAMQCFENFGGGEMPPPWLRACWDLVHGGHFSNMDFYQYVLFLRGKTNLFASVAWRYFVLGMSLGHTK